VNYGGHVTRPLAAASAGFFAAPPGGGTDPPLLSDRGLLWLADETRMDGLGAIAAAPEGAGQETVLLDATPVLELVPRLRPDRVAGGGVESQARDIDVAGLHQAFVRIARRHGSEIITSSPVTSIRRDGSGWQVIARGNTFGADVVVNAAGAWGDTVA